MGSKYTLPYNANPRATPVNVPRPKFLLVSERRFTSGYFANISRTMKKVRKTAARIALVRIGSDPSHFLRCPYNKKKTTQHRRMHMETIPGIFFFKKKSS